MKRFVDEHLAAFKETELKILDLGSQDVNGTYKDLFQNKKWSYIGVDMVKGKNVDVVVRDIYDWKEFGSDSMDVVISGQAFEHIEFIWKTVLEVKRVMKPGGIGCLIAPSSGFEHRYPVDCWRIYPDGFRALAKYASLEVLDVYMTDDELARSVGEENVWKDTVLVFKKPNE